MLDHGDLSALERQRLENIRRNREFLESLGIAHVEDVPDRPKEPAKQVIALRKKERNTVREVAARRSPRLAGLKVEDLVPQQPIKEVIPPSSGDTIDYDNVPETSDELDDFEYEAFVKTRSWRLITSRELNVEPYKIFQNRTLCEFIRRKRNDSEWANLAKAEVEVVAELQQCWGIGRVKAQRGEAAWKLDALFENDEMKSLLVSSRQLGVSQPKDEQETMPVKTPESFEEQDSTLTTIHTSKRTRRR